jgi:hypothetical protein
MFVSLGVFLLIQPNNQIELFNFFYKYSAIPCELINFSPLSELQFYENNCYSNQSQSIFQKKIYFLAVILCKLFSCKFYSHTRQPVEFSGYLEIMSKINLGQIRYIIFVTNYWYY